LLHALTAGIGTQRRFNDVRSYVSGNVANDTNSTLPTLNRHKREDFAAMHSALFVQ